MCCFFNSSLLILFVKLRSIARVILECSFDLASTPPHSFHNSFAVIFLLICSGGADRASLLLIAYCLYSTIIMHRHPYPPFFLAFGVSKHSVPLSDPSSPFLFFIHPPSGPCILIYFPSLFGIFDCVLGRTFSKSTGPASIENSNEWDDGREFVEDGEGREQGWKRCACSS